MEETEDFQIVEVSKDVIKGWTKDEKFYLLLALKTFGMHNIKKIQEYVSTKSLDETKAAVDYFKHIAIQHPVFEKRREVVKSKFTRKPRVPLACWAQLLTDALNFNELRTETATAVRLIADLEKIPSPVCTDTIDFRQVYHQIANALEGKAVAPDLATTAILYKCVSETALSSKAFIKNVAYKYVINTIDLSDKEINMFPRPTEDKELSILRHLASQRSYNPLKVKEEYLKPSCETTWNESMLNKSD